MAGIRAKCIEAANAANGKDIDQKDLYDIVGKFARAERTLKVADPVAWQNMTPQERIRAQAKEVVSRIGHDVKEATRRMKLDSAANKRNEGFMIADTDAGQRGIDSFRKNVVTDAGYNNDRESLQGRIEGNRAYYRSKLTDAIDFLKPKVLEMFRGSDTARAFMKALAGEDLSAFPKDVQGAAMEAAGQWKQLAEDMRQKFNQVGGDIAQRADWLMTQMHNYGAIRAEAIKNKDNGASWIGYVMGKLDRGKYLDENGVPLKDAEMGILLHQMWESIVTLGTNETGAFKFEGTKIANKYSGERTLIFKNADASMDYQEKYGNPNILDTMINHVDKMSRDIARMEKFGPSADTNAENLLRLGVSHDVRVNPEQSAKIQSDAKAAWREYEYMTGKTNPVVNENLATASDSLRSWIMSVIGGGFTITQLPHTILMPLTMLANGMPLGRMLGSLEVPFNAEITDRLRRNGICAESGLNYINKFMADNMASRFSQGASDLVMHVSGMNAMNKAKELIMGASIFSSLGHNIAKFGDITTLPDADARLLKSYGIDAATYEVWRKAELEHWSNGLPNVLTPESISEIENATQADKNDAIVKLLALAHGETNIALAQPNAEQLAPRNVSIVRGTLGGEVLHQGLFLKNFFLTVLDQQIKRLMAQPTLAGKITYGATYLAGTIAMGAVVTQIKELINGRNPMAMNTQEFALKSLLQSGALGIYGDMLFKGLDTQYGHGDGLINELGGPTSSYIQDFYNVARDGVNELRGAQKNGFSSSLIKFGRDNVPGANLWYTKAITDRLIWNNLMEQAHPGYMMRVQQRAQSGMYWPPNQVLPTQAPDLSKAVGAQ